MPRYKFVSFATLAAAVAGSAGCANLDVKKVPLDQRAANTDEHHHGFRYYLTRPYVAVTAPIEVSVRKTLVSVRKGEGADKMTYLDGPKAGQLVRPDALEVTNPGDGLARKLTPAELNAMRTAVDAGQTDPAVRQAAAADPDTKPLTDAGAAAGVGNPTLASPDLSGSIQIVHLPDLDEQYAVKSQNVLAKSTFRLDFADGRLNGVTAEHDTTTLAVAVLRTIDSVVNAERDLQKAMINREANLRKNRGAGFTDKDDTVYYFLIERVIIKPGMYRLNKPWECEGDGCAAGTGLLAKLGLPTAMQIEIKPTE